MQLSPHSHGTKFSHQTQNFSFCSSFLLHDNGVLTPLEPQLCESVIFRKWNTTFFWTVWTGLAREGSEVMAHLAHAHYVSILCVWIHCSIVSVLCADSWCLAVPVCFYYMSLHWWLPAWHVYIGVFSCSGNHGDAKEKGKTFLFSVTPI